MMVRGQAHYDRLTPLLAGRTDEDAAEWQRAYEDALRDLSAVPDPELFAAELEEHHRDALRSAWRGECGYRVHSQHLYELRLLGLVEVSGDPKLPAGRIRERNYLTAFGFAVRRAIIASEELD